MLKHAILLIILTFTANTFAADNVKPPVPQIFTLNDLKGENPEFLVNYMIIGNYEQRIQLEDGKMSKELGRVLAIQKEDILYIAFYYTTDSGKYRKIGRTIAIKNTSLPRQDMHPEYNIPCLILNRNDNQGIYRVYLYNGKSVIQKGETDTTSKK